MNKLSIVSTFVLITKALVIAGCVFSIVFLSIFVDNEKMIHLGNPMWEVNSETSLGQSLSDPEVPENFKIDAILLKLIVPMSFGLKAALILAVLAFTAYSLIVINITKKVIDEVKALRPFSIENARRIKHLGLLIALVPIASGMGSKLFGMWVQSQYQFEGLSISTQDTSGMPFFVIGVLIYVLGVAFVQGAKLQEDYDLTV